MDFIIFFSFLLNLLSRTPLFAAGADSVTLLLCGPNLIHLVCQQLP